MVLRLWTPEIAEIGDRLANLSGAQAEALSDYLAKTHGIVAARVTGLDLPEPDVVVEEDTVEPAAFSVVLEGCGANRRITVIRAVRDLLGLGLRDALALVDGTPSIIKENLPHTEAQILKANLEAAGATVSLRPSTA
jgi:large subunit ribosomal protein L7/L12